MDRTELMKNIVATLDSKKATNIKSLEITELSSVADYFVIATGNSTTQVSSLSEEVEYRLSQYGITPRAIEGTRGDSWILSDYNCVILHVFNQESRDFYKLEKLYNEGSEVSIADIITED